MIKSLPDLQPISFTEDQSTIFDERMVEETKAEKSENQHIPDKSGWSAFATVTTFDRGKCPKWKTENALVSRKATEFAPSSLFVESLIDQLCKLFEKDPDSQKKLYGLICQKLYKMKLIDKTYEVEEFQFLRNYYQRALYHLLAVSNSPTIDTKLEKFLSHPPGSLSLPPYSPSNIFDWSRYQNEFEEIEFIAKGGFGSVFRVRNKVDGCEYAIKKICLRYRNKEHFFQSLKEVRTLANLDHCNIVAYKAAWLEPISSLIAEEGSSGSTSSKISPEDPSKPESSVSDQELKDDIGEDSGNIVFTSKTDNSLDIRSSSLVPKLSVEDKDDILHEDSHLSNKEVSSGQEVKYMKSFQFSFRDSSLCEHSSRANTIGCRGHKLVRRHGEYECLMLHIQMQLCKKSLREWLDLRNEALQRLSLENSIKETDQDAMVNNSKHSHQLELDNYGVITALHIFLNILNGVAYVHDMGIVHHDLKPSNVFIDGYDYGATLISGKNDKTCSQEELKTLFEKLEENRKSQVRVGDFGLACLSHPSTPDNGEMDDLQDKSLAVIPAHITEEACHVEMGHHPSREMKEKDIVGTKLYAAPEQLHGHCNPKSDIYSLGIILFELLHPFFTAMERNKVISDLRKGNIPEKFEKWNPFMAKLIKDLLSNDPNERPSINAIINMLKPILKAKRKNSKIKCESDIYSSKESSFTEITHIQESHFQESCQGIHYANEKLLVNKSQEFFQSCQEILSKGELCANYSCQVIREEQERTITKLKEENSKKDETIEELRNQIFLLRNSFKRTEKIEH